MLNRKKRGLFYLRFLYSLVPSISSIFSNPASISCAISCIVLAVLHVNWSFCSRNRACSRLMYIIVLSMLLCPKTVLTWIMSLVLWYSVVPFQCRKVWKWICFSLGLLSFLAVVLRCDSKVFLIPYLLVWKTFSLIFVRLLNMAESLGLIGSIRLLLPFSAVM